MKKKISDIKEMLIEEVFTLDLSKKLIFVVPPYQRPYSWRPGHLEQLFDDLDNNPPGYFLGSMLCVESEDDAFGSRLEVVDGQQRLIALSLLLATFYKVLDERRKELGKKEKTDETDKEQDDIIEKLIDIRKRLTDTSDGNDQADARVIPQITGSNQDNYRALLSDIGIINRGGMLNKRNKLYNARRYFKERIGGGARDLKGVKELLDKLWKAWIVLIRVDSASDAHTLFAALNDRGMKLSVVDLIKNKIFSALKLKRGSREEETTLKDWEALINALGGEKGTSIQERFFFHYYNAFMDELNEPFRKKEEEKNPDKKRSYPWYPLGRMDTMENLLKVHEKLIEEDPKKYLANILQKSKLYSELIYCKTEDDSLDRELDRLNDIQGASSYILLLYLLAQKDVLNLEWEQLSEIVRLIRCLLVRRHLLNTPSAQRLVRHFADMAQTVKDVKEKRGDIIVESVRSGIRSVRPSDGLFEEALKGDIYKDKHRVTNFILRALEEEKGDKTRDVWGKEKDKFVWSIEHILPRRDERREDDLPQCWVDMIAKGKKDQAKEIQQREANKLGNLTLTAHNSKLGNACFEDKRDKEDEEGNPIGYDKGENTLWLDRYVVKDEGGRVREKWGGSEIKGRTQRLAREVVGLFQV